MNEPLRLLLVEDSEDDALLLLRELKHGGFEVEHTRVETVEAMELALRTQQWDMVVSDFMLPNFNGLDALERVKVNRLDLPFIMVSGKLGEDAAVEAMRAGAKDYITKGNLSRLAPAVRRELAEAANRRAKQQSDVRAASSEEKFHSLFNAVSDAIFFVDMQGRILEVNAEACRRLGYSREELLRMSPADIDTPEHAGRVMEHLRTIEREGRSTFETEHVRRDGSRIPTEVAGQTVNTGGIPGILAVARDISERKHAEEERLAYIHHLQAVLEDTIHAIASTIEKRDAYTSGHQFRVSTLAVAIARELGLSEEQITGIRLGALIHDIGMIAIPAEILSRPSALSDVEFRLVMIHPDVGADIVGGIQFPWPIRDILHQHHERLDGSGYPEGLKDDAIQLEARIVGVADVVEAMCSHRPYRPALGLDAALEEITQHKATRYDPAVVDACVRLFREKGFSLVN